MQELDQFCRAVTPCLEEINGRSFYAESFALAFLSLRKALTPKIKESLTRSFLALDKEGEDFHWEFNRYALSYYQKTSGDTAFHSFLEKGKFKGTKCTNWTLLRALVSRSWEEAFACLQERQLESGFIVDEVHVRSFQYHCFSLALVYEIYESSQDKRFLVSFQKGLQFIRPFILRNGDCNYIGRGQEQSFGYASLLFALAKGYSLEKDASILQQISRVFGFLKKHQKPDGSLPLVLNQQEEQNPRLGWYAYNNHYDYLAFTAFFVERARETLLQVEEKMSVAPPQNYSDSYFKKITKPSYEAVVAAPGGAWTNDLSIPYLVSDGKTLMPCYGGEQFEDSVYSKIDTPLPFFPLFNRTFSSKGRAWLSGSSLWIVSPLGILKRTYNFQDKEINIQTIVLSPFPCKQQLLVFATMKQKAPDVLVGENLVIRSSAPMQFERTAYSALGTLSVYTCKKKFWTLQLEVLS